MKRLTKRSAVSNTDTLLNYSAAENGRVYLAYGNGEEHVDLCEYVSSLAFDHGCDVSSDDVMDGVCMGCDCMVAILYTLAVQAAELRERLITIEDIIGDEYDLDELREKLALYERAEKEERPEIRMIERRKKKWI